MSNFNKEQDECFQHDWYEILNCKDYTCSNEVIEKLARKMAIKYHPDKNSDQDAPEKFLLVQKAKEILLDSTKRKIIDDHRNAKIKREEYESARNSNMDNRRKRMRDELNERLNKVHSSQVNLSKQETYKNDLQKRSKIIEELRKNNIDLMEKTTYDNINMETKRAQDLYNKAKEFKNSNNNCQIKIKWKKLSLSHSDDSLYNLFKQFGIIEDNIIIGSKGTSATITFTTIEAAKNAYEHYRDSLEYRVTIVSDNDCYQNTSDVYNKNKEQNDLSNDIKRALEKNNLLDIIGKLKRNSSDVFTSNNTLSSQPIDDSNNPINSTKTITSSIQEHSNIISKTELINKEANIMQKMLEVAKKKKEAALAKQQASVSNVNINSSIL